MRPLDWMSSLRHKKHIRISIFIIIITYIYSTLLERLLYVIVIFNAVSQLNTSAVIMQARPLLWTLILL